MCAHDLDQQWIELVNVLIPLFTPIVTDIFFVLNKLSIYLVVLHLVSLNTTKDAS